MIPLGPFKSPGVRGIAVNVTFLLLKVREFDHYLMSLPLPTNDMVSAVSESLLQVSQIHGITKQEQEQRQKSVQDLADKLKVLAPGTWTPLSLKSLVRYSRRII